MLDAIIGLAVLAVGLFAAFFAGGRKEKKKSEQRQENRRIATQGRITDALDGVIDDDDWVKRLHERHK